MIGLFEMIEVITWLGYTVIVLFVLAIVTILIGDHFDD